MSEQKSIIRHQQCELFTSSKETTNVSCIKRLSISFTNHRAKKKTKKKKKTYLDKNGNQNTLPGDINDHNFYYWILMIWSVHLSHHNSWKYKLAISLNYKEVQSTLITGMCNPDEISKINITTKYIFFCWTNCV